LEGLWRIIRGVEPQRPSLKSKLLRKRKRVTYIVGIRSLQGVVLSADSQETILEEVSYREKIAACPTHDLVMGGAGRSILIEGFIQQVFESIDSKALESEKSAMSFISTALKSFYLSDVKDLAGRYKEISFLISGKLQTGEICLWQTKGKRVFSVPEYEAIGYESSFVRHLLRRLYRAGLSLSQVELLSIYLVKAAKETADSVGGPTSVAVVSGSGVTLENEWSINELEERVSRFDEALSLLLLACPDTSISRDEFTALLRNFWDYVMGLREHYHGKVIGKEILRTFDPNWKPNPVPRLPSDTIIEQKQEGDKTVQSIKFTLSEPDLPPED
jgi:20S proteasome alpha/beta subunit